MKILKTAAICLVIAAIAVFALLHFGEKSDLVSSPMACVNNSLSSAASGHCVSDLQNLLNWSLYGIDGPNYQKVTGQFDATTKTEVTKFQTSNTITPTGSVTTQTWQKLCSADSDAPTVWLSAAKDAGCKL